MKQYKFLHRTSLSVYAVQNLALLGLDGCSLFVNVDDFDTSVVTPIIEGIIYGTI